ncbi:uncharacterized protein LOC110959900 [Acanthochromis polyacanthus]|uniref:uncharacterized protein LOC110959900 n=1 Tax=Acanthochromis polyacanthus TaxID=80966 RepID=UPI002234C8FB|nr:uncharacterized protein LOC110959900 [Acanthochromis polyacanthus]
MIEFRWTGMSLFLIVVLQFTGALSRQLDLSSIVREGDEATLSCENVVDDHHDCNTTTWIFAKSKMLFAVELVDLGQIKNEVNIDRLSLTANCSLVIKKVKTENVGRYTCRQIISGKQQGEDANVDLSVVTVTEHKDTDIATLNCSVGTDEPCGHTVKWVFMGETVDKDHPNIKTSQSSCSATVSFLSDVWGSPILYHNWFKCSVSTEDTQEPLIFSVRPSGEDTKTTTTTTANNRKGDTTMTGSAIGDTTAKLHGQWRIMVVTLGLAALITTAVAVNIWARTKGKTTQTGENRVCNDEDDGL